jgi:hypothetical protein
MEPPLEKSGKPEELHAAADGLTHRSGGETNKAQFVRPLVVMAVIAGLATCASWEWWYSFGPGWRGYARSAETRLVALRSPYKNTEPKVKYVGSAACARCHEEIARTYSQHPMGRSLAPVTDDVLAEMSPAKFVAQGLEYSIERKGNALLHREVLRDATGKLLTNAEARVDYVLGSGERGISFVINRDGYLFQSPISWYAQSGRWDISPGYERDNSHFSRPIIADCLFCHANRVNAVSESQNHYRTPIFDGYAIGCERCHGPGELHVRKPAAGAEGTDWTIVNPARLAPALRDSVCLQCHLQGVTRVARYRRQATDYRPGLPIEEFLSVFVRPGTERGTTLAVGQVEQMAASRCFRESRGMLGCISCHDPHERPDPRDRVAYYRSRCLECHDKKGCTLPAATRFAKSADDSCIACHMPGSSSTDIAHTATTLHTIPRTADASHTPEAAGPAPASAGTDRLCVFSLYGSQSAVDSGRDLGVALRYEILARKNTAGAAVIAGKARRLLEPALGRTPDDLAAWQAEAAALSALGRRQEAEDASDAVLVLSPESEMDLEVGALLAAVNGHWPKAVSRARSAVEMNPWSADYRFTLASLLAYSGDPRHSLEASGDALRLNSLHMGARQLRAQCYQQIGDYDKARAELDAIGEMGWRR